MLRWTFLRLPSTLCTVTDDQEAARLRVLVEQRRAALGYNSQRALAEAAGLPIRTLVDFLSGPRTRRATTMHKLEQALLWAAGSIIDVLAGGQPTLLDVAEVPDSRLEVDRLPVGLGLDAEADGLTGEQVEAVRVIIRTIKGRQ